MPSDVPPGRLRREMGRDHWGPPMEYGPNGWIMQNYNGRASVIVSVGRFEDGEEWVHASIARSDRMPDYLDLTMLHRAAFGDGFAYQCFVPPADHVNFHQQALHLWGRLDGTNVLPDFGAHGMI